MSLNHQEIPNKYKQPQLDFKPKQTVCNIYNLLRTIEPTVWHLLLENSEFSHHFGEDQTTLHHKYHKNPDSDLKTSAKLDCYR